jgi:hypothetical protein
MTETGKIQNSNAKLHKPPCKSNYQFVSKIGGNLAIATKIIVLLIHQYFQEATLVFFFIFTISKEKGSRFILDFILDFCLWQFIWNYWILMNIRGIFIKITDF